MLDYFDARKQHLDQVETGAGDPAKTSGVFRPVPIESFYLSPDEMKSVQSDYRCRYNSSFHVETDQDRVDFGGQLGRNFLIERQTDGVNVFDAAASYVKSELLNKKRIILASWTEGSSERLGGVLADHDLIVGQIDRRQFKDLSAGQVKRTILPIEQGFTFDDLIVLSEQDILGDRLVNRARRRKAKNFISEASALKPKDLIIHIDHGLGRYLGLKTLDVTGCLLYTSPSPRDQRGSRMPSSA